MTAPDRGCIPPPRSPLRPPSAPILRRGVACWIDMVVLLLCSLPFHALVHHPVWVFPAAGGLRMTHPVIEVGACLCMLMPESWLLVTAGASIGKLICGLRVVARDGGAISRRSAWIRTGVKMLSWLLAIPFLIQAVVLLGRRPRTFWDACAGSRVVLATASSA